MKRSSCWLVAAVAATVALPAAAADLQPVYKAPSMFTKTPAANWSGGYVGVHIGFANVQDKGTLVGAPPPLLQPIGSSITASDTAFIGGGQAGYNWQFGQHVLGIEGDISGATHSYSVSTPSPLIAGAVTGVTANIHWLATITGRVGYAMNGWLPYIKGGAAFMDATYGGSVTSPLGTAIVNNIDSTRVGWTVGAGVERPLINAWTWKVEYNYMRFENTYTSTTTPPTGASVNRLETDVHAVKFGVNYRLGAWR